MANREVLIYFLIIVCGIEDCGNDCELGTVYTDAGMSFEDVSKIWCVL